MSEVFVVIRKSKLVKREPTSSDKETGPKSMIFLAKCSAKTFISARMGDRMEG